MSKVNSRGDLYWQLVGGISAALGLTAASLLWRLPQAHSPQAILAVYITSFLLLVSGAFVIFRKIVWRGYASYHGLTPLPTFLQFLICGAFMILGYAVLWPSRYAIGWMMLFAIMIHLMVLTEEEFLGNMYGEAYVQYCQQVPRYVGTITAFKKIH